MVTAINFVSRSKPVADQVEEILRERIRSGRYASGERIPSEDQLAEELRVSRATIRSALTALATDGLVRRRQGDGTYAISNRKKQEPIKRAWIYSDFLETNGQHRHTQEFARLTQQPTLQEVEALGLNPGEQVQLTRFVITIDQKPVIFATHTYRGSSPFLLNQASEQENLPLTEYLEAHDGSIFGLVQVHFRGTIADGKNVPEEVLIPGTAIIKIEAILSDTNGQPFVLFNEFHMRDEGYLAVIAHPVFEI